jgi:hypothetical protein
MRRYSIGGVIYIVIGIIMSANRGYFTDLSTLGHILSALVAIILWPLLLLGVNLHLGL